MKHLQILTVFTVLFVSACGAATTTELLQTNHFNTFLRQHEAELRRVVGTNQEIAALLDAPGQLSAESSVRLLSLLAAQTPRTNLLVENVAIHCLLEGLIHPDWSVRHIAFSWVAPSVNYSRVHSNYAAQLLAACSENRVQGNWEIVRLLAATGTAEGHAFIREIEPNLFSKGSRFPEEILGKIGVPGVEDSLVQRFHSATNALIKCDLALKLGYVGSSNAVKALTGEMRSPMVVVTQGLDYSVRYKIIEALGRVFPESQLFNEEFQTATAGSPADNDVAGRRARQEAYVNKVEQWCRDNFSIQWTVDRPAEPLYTPKWIVHPAGPGR